jgi:hypothetical protein
MVYYFKKPPRMDGFMYEKSNAEGLTSYHIHSIEWVDKSGDNMAFEALLPKSSSFRTRSEPNLAQEKVDDWFVACAGMNTSTLNVVTALAAFFKMCGMTDPVEVGVRPE